MSDSPDELILPRRPARPRETGLTFISDVGVPVGELAHLLNDYDSMVDFAKFGVGSAYVTPNLREKLGLYREHGIVPYFGGTLFEKFQFQDNLDGYCRFLKAHEVEWIEISNGTIPLTLEQRCEIVRKVSGDFEVIAEVGCKDAETIMSPSSWIEELKELIDAGARYVVTEGRDSGSAGIFRPSGEIREGLVADIVKSLPVNRLVFEAPNAKSQMYFINLCGPEVNLGNVAPRDLLLLEAQRRGLRYETFFLDSDEPSS